MRPHLPAFVARMKKQKQGSRHPDSYRDRKRRTRPEGKSRVGYAPAPAHLRGGNEITNRAAHIPIAIWTEKKRNRPEGKSGMGYAPAPARLRGGR